MFASATSVMRVTVPSPLVGEGLSAINHNLTRVRGRLSARSLPKQPLTRLRFAKPPFPTWGEESAPHLSASIT